MAQTEDKPQSKALNYCYFASSIDPNVPKAQPKQLTEEEVAEQQKLLEQQGKTGASAWNHAGTFEERSWSELGKSFLTERLVGSCGPVTVKSLKELKGTANTWIVRGKPRHGFDYEITVCWVLEGSGVEGNASFPNAASDELDDLHCELLNSKNEQESFKPDVKKKVVSALVPHLQKVLGDLLLEIKKK